MPNIFKKVSSSNSLFYHWGEAMHTRIDIVLSINSQQAGQEIAARIMELLHRLEALGNRFDIDSEVSRINRTAWSSAITIDSELFNIIEDCTAYNKMSCGCFDITAHHGQRGMMDQVVLDCDAQTILLPSRESQLDLSGVLKGYALDATKEILLSAQIEGSLVNFGNSSIMATGNHPCGNGWRVGTQEGGTTLHNSCLTTSGNLSATTKHLVRPSTGELIDSQGTISVLTTSGAIGEAFTTAMAVATPQQQEVIMASFDKKLLSQSGSNTLYG